MQSQFLLASGIQTHILFLGEGDLTTIMLHGWGGSTKSFVKEEKDGLADLLHKKTEGKIAIIDVPGFGKSQMPPTSGWNSENYAIWLQNILKKLNFPSNGTLIGHSNGGRIILRYLSQNINDKNKKIVLLGSAGIKPPKTLRERMIKMCKTPLKWAKHILPKRIQKVLIKKILKAHDWAECPESLKNTLTKLTQEKCFQHFLPEIQNKTLLLWGKNDGMTPISSGKTMKNHLPHAKLHIFEDGRHGIHHTHTKLSATLILEFIKNN